MSLSRRSFLTLTVLGTVAPLVGVPLSAPEAGTGALEVYKSPYCGCCGAWVDHMRAAGFYVSVVDVEDLGPIKTRLGVARDLQSCHTAVVDGYVVEGHVPAREVTRLLKERPAATGLSVPGMPIGSPGMEQGGRRDPYQVILFAPSSRLVSARY